MLTRPQDDKDLILKNLEETYYIENFVSKEDIQELCDIFDNSDNKVYKKTGPITSTITDFKIPVMIRIKDKIHNLQMKISGVKPTDSHIDCIGCGS